MKQYVITVEQDEETRRYTGTCDDVRGLVVEADSIEEVVEIALDLIPGLVADNLEHDMRHTLPPLVQLAKFCESRIN